MKIPASKRKLETTRMDDLIFRKINEANKLAKNDPQAALGKVEEALTMSYKMNSPRAEAYAYNTLGAINYELSRYEIATQNYEKAVGIFDKIGDQQGRYNSLKYLGMSQDGMGDSEKALKTYSLFQTEAEKENRIEDMIEASNRISRIQFNNQNFEQALEGFHKTLVLQESSRDSSGIVQSYLHLGRVNQQIGNSDKAIEYFENADSLATNLGDSLTASNSLDYLSGLYRNQQDLDNELQVQQRALSSNRSFGYSSREGKVSKRIGDIYVEQNQIAEAIPYFKNSINLAAELGELRSQQEAYEALAGAYEKAGNIDEAIVNYRGAMELSDQIQAKELEAIADSFSLEKQLAQKDLKIAMLRKDQELNEEKFRSMQELQNEKIARQNTIMYALVAGLILVLISGFFILRSYRARRKANQLLMLKSLRSQMNPHFIFNSLNSINSFIAKQDERSANKYLSSFSRLMRTVLENSQQDFVPLSTEIEVLERYLSLEHFRFMDKFEYEFLVDESVNKDQIDIPPMLIQPYVENAVWHGLRYKEEKGFLKLKLSQESAHLLIEIEDNGIGRERSQELKTKHQKAQKSTGLKNTEERLKIINELYKKEVKVSIGNLDPSAEDVGTRVEIKLPI
ncbi:MAG: histidine kinase [Bacteroidia bacterium]|nr:histidine kinase [Bacteroidia bacterium]